LPFWLPDEVDDMGETIKKMSLFVQVCRDSLSDVTSDRVVLEDKLRRAHMLLTDRQVLISEAQETLVHLRVDELVVCSLIEEGSLSLGVESVDTLTAQLDTILFKKACQEWIGENDSLKKL